MDKFKTLVHGDIRKYSGVFGADAFANATGTGTGEGTGRAGAAQAGTAKAAPAAAPAGAPLLFFQAGASTCPCSRST